MAPAGGAKRGLNFRDASCIIFRYPPAGVMELVDVTDSKSVGGDTVWVRVPPPAPARRKRHIACDELFHFIAKLIARSFCCSSLPTATCCAGLAVVGRRCAAVLSVAERISILTAPASSPQATYRLRRAFSFHCKEGDTRLRVSLGASGSPPQVAPQGLTAQGVRSAKRGLLRFHSSGGTASWKLAQVCSAASTCAQVYMARSHSAQVRYRK